MHSNLWFIDISTVYSRIDFTNWLSGKIKNFDDSNGFQDWLVNYNTFPLEIFLNDVLYRFENKNEALFFLLGFEAARGLDY